MPIDEDDKPYSTTTPIPETTESASSEPTEVPLISDENGKSVLHGVTHGGPYGCGVNATYPGNVFTSVYSMINFVDEVIVSTYTG